MFNASWRRPVWPDWALPNRGVNSALYHGTGGMFNLPERLFPARVRASRGGKDQGWDNSGTPQRAYNLNLKPSRFKPVATANMTTPQAADLATAVRQLDAR